MTGGSRPAVARAITRVRRDALRLNKAMERRELIAAIHRLTQSGKTAKQIEYEVGMTDRNVQRLRFVELPPLEPEPEFDMSAERVRDLEQTAETAIELACLLRDEDPRMVWAVLGKLDRQHVQELAVVLLAAMPVERELSEVFGWVLDLPAARVPA